MDKKIAFSILQIEETTDENLIKEAYRNHLVKVNPEDDPEGFKRLREAYETACYSIQNPETEENENIDTPIGKWMTSIKQRYNSLAARMDEEGWKRELKEAVCIDLETSLEARNELLKYLMDHYRLKKEIWCLIDERFLICDEANELTENFPKEFIDFIVYQCQREEDGFPYEEFEGEDNADYDSFLYHYYELAQNIDEQKYDAASQIVETMEKLCISHPLFTLEKARLAQGQGKKEEAIAYADTILEENKENIRIKAFGGQILWENEYYDRAAELFLEIIEKMPEHYLANKRLGHYYLEKGEYEKAKTYTLVPLRTGSQEEEVLEDMKRINDALILQFKQECKEQPDNIKRHLDLAWCYLQNQKTEEGIELLESVEPDEENQTEYYSAKGRLYLAGKQYEKALVYSEKWLECIKLEKGETQEEKDKIPLRIATACSVAAEAIQQILEETKEEALFQDYFDRAVHYIEEAIECEPDNVRNYAQEAELYKIKKDYQKVVDICNIMQEKDPEYFWTYIYRQEAFEKLGNAQEVIDDFYRARAIFPYYVPMYEKVVEVFMDFEQWEDALSTLKKAEEVSISSTRLKLNKITIQRILIKNAEEWEKLYEECKDLKKELQKQEDTKPEELAEIFYETARCLRGLDRQDEALKEIDEAIHIKPNNQYIWIKANILLSKRNYTEALHLYKICEKEFPESDLVLGNIAICYKNIPNQMEKAIACFKQVLNINPENKMANGELSDIYTEKFKDTEDLKYYNLALPYADRQIELTPEAYYYIERGLLYMEAGMWEPALEDFREAIKLEPDNTYAYNNMGCVYKYTKHYREAIEAFQKAAEVMKEGETLLPFGNLGDTYERMGEYKKALEAYLENEKLFPKSRTTYRSTIDVYRMLKRFPEALEKLKYAYEEDSFDYYLKQGDIYEEMKDIGKALKAYKKALAKKEREEEAWYAIGDLYLNSKRDIKAARKAFQKSFELSKKGTQEYLDSCEMLTECYQLLHKIKESRKFFELAVEYYKEKYGGVEEYIKATRTYQMARLYRIGKLYFDAGYIKEAEAFFERMEKEEICRKCSYKGCREYYAAKAMLSEYRKEREEAVNCWKKALEIDPNWQECERHLEQL